MRKQMLSVFLAWLTLGLLGSAAETPASQPASQRNELQRVNVVRGANEIRVEINARGAVTPKLSTADSPARLVVDLPNFSDSFSHSVNICIVCLSGIISANQLIHIYG